MHIQVEVGDLELAVERRQPLEGLVELGVGRWATVTWGW